MSSHVIIRRLPLRPSPTYITGTYTTRLHLTTPLRRYAIKRTPTETSEEDLASARKWLANLTSETIPRSIGEVTFSRSSGPGGQNVNKYV